MGASTQATSVEQQAVGMARHLGDPTTLAEVCAFLGDARRAATLYQFLLPHNGYNIVIGPTAACYGAASRYLGILATTMQHWEVAQQHFEDALEMNARMGAQPWLAHTQHVYAQTDFPLLLFG